MKKKEDIMKAKKQELFFVKETPDDYEIDLGAPDISQKEMEKLVKESVKKKKVQKAKRNR